MKLIVAAFLLVILAVSCTSIAQAATFQLFKDEHEGLAFFRVNDKPGRVLYSIGPLDLTSGTIVDIKFQAELTNDLGYNVGVGRYVVRTHSPVSTTGVRVIKAVMSNVTPNEHHQVLIHTGAEEIKENLSGVYYNVVIYANSSAGDGNLKVEKGRGELIVEIRDPR
jgi:hypothetical protein